ncbi:Hypothetical protein CINCED_3A023606 [Cinara cedri]|uniref:Uncharacterized protein n=1 Tax=Cinara cedri TaxID=506608 RepID=A0A5E4M2Z4_9HEMI|nr:Hypothetical protein CINCED_3A023606 [Cinara cedri]
MNLNKSLNETIDQIEEVMDATEFNFDTKESMNNISEISVKTTDLTDCNNEESIAADLEITSTNSNVMDTKFVDKLYNTVDNLKDTESKIDTDESLNNIYNINVDETSQSCELDNSTLKNITNIDISYAEEKNLTHSSENSVTNNGTLQNSSRAMRQFLDFEQTLYEICNPKLNDSTFNDSQTNRNISLNEQTVETYLNTSNENDSFCTSANPLESNLSVIIENRTLEENSSDLVMQNEEFENPINTVLENIVNENLDNIVLNESVILNNKESLVAKDILLPEVLKLSTVNEMENKTCESVMKSNEGIFIDNKVISSDEKMNEIKCNESCSISSYKFLKPESNVLLNKDIQSLDLLDETRNINNSLNDFMNMEQMFNFGENRTIQMLNLDTPKTQKILDFSIVPQTPIVENHAKKQKLLNFSIVDQTPISKDTQQKSFNNSFTKNNLSGINEILELETDSINKDYQNCINNSSSKNLSTISAPDTQSFIDISINSDNSIINQTLTETNLNESKTNTVGSNMDSIEYCMKESIPEVVKSVINCASNITLNKNSKKLDCSTILTDSDEKIITKSNKNAIVDFSIIEQPIPHTFRINNDTNITFVESKTNISNLIDSSVVSMIDAKSKGYVFDSLQNPTIVVSSDIEIETEKSLTSTLDYCSVNNSTTRLEQSTFSHNSELLTDVQMNDLSLFIESEKSSVNESFHSIELDHVKEDKKRKLEPVQDYNNFEKIMKIESKDPELDHVPEDSKIKIEPVQVNYNSEKKIKVESKDIESYHVQGDNKRKIKPVYDFHNSEKKMKVESEEPKTPISMLYKIKNMFKSNEKLPQYKNNTKSENRFNFNKLKDDKPEVLVKSKIPYKVTNTPRAQNDEFNNSKSLNDNKSKKGIPKFIGLPALSDLSNKTFPGQNSKFH